MLCMSQEVSAQKEESPRIAATKDYLFKRQLAGGLKLQTTGINVFVQYGLIKTIYSTHLMMLEYEYNLDFKEKLNKPFDQNYDKNSSYYFGRQSKLHVIRASYGFERALADKAPRSGVRLSWVGFAGVSMALVKPYYLLLKRRNVRNDQDSVSSEPYSDANKDVFLDKTRIVGAGSIADGFGGIRPVFGGHVRTGLNFDWGKRDAFAKSIEAGVTIDIYYKKIPIWTDDDQNKWLYFGLYVGVQFGKRW
jgi:hypothetical protein